jgi:hypothetical protein
MKPNTVIYEISQIREYKDIWAHLSKEEKQQVLDRMADRGAEEIGKVLQEIKTGQYRLF